MKYKVLIILAIALLTSSCRKVEFSLTVSDVKSEVVDYVEITGKVAGDIVPDECGIIYGTDSDFLSGSLMLSCPYPGQEFTVSISQLQPRTTYYYKAYAAKGIVERFSATKSFTTSDPQRDVLMAFYEDTNGSEWINNTNWGSASDLSTWYGVGVEDGVVTSLRLPYNHLHGNISNTLAPLQSLKTLILSPQYGAIDIAEANVITGMDLTANKSLDTLICACCSLQQLDVSGNVALSALFCQTNALTSLDVTKNVALKTLCCLENRISSLDLKACLALEDLLCANNQLTALNVTDNAALLSLSFESNMVDAIDVRRNTALVSLHCEENNISSLNLASNVNLETLVCRYNKIDTLDLSTNTRLTTLCCNDNRLSSLDINPCGSLNYLTAGNQTDRAGESVILSLYCSGGQKSKWDSYWNFLPDNRNIPLVVTQ